MVGTDPLKYDTNENGIKQNAQKIETIYQAITLCENEPETVVRLLRQLVSHNSAMIKALQKCKRVETIKTYVLIFERFGDNVKEFEDRNLFFEEFRFAGNDDKNYELLEEIINKDSNALCFTYSIKDDGTINDKFCVVSVEGANSKNPTIRYKKSDYNYLLTKEGIDELGLDQRVVDQLIELANALKHTREVANGREGCHPHEKSSIENDWSIEPWLVTNCAEVWGAFEMILQGRTFDSLEMFAFYNTKNIRGDYHKPCQNCQITFIRQLSKMLDEGLIDASIFDDVFWEIKNKEGI